LNKICGLMGIQMEDGEPQIPWFGEYRSISSGNEAEQIIWMHYLSSSCVTPPTGQLISFRELPSGMFYGSVFSKRSETPLLKRFGDTPELLVKSGVKVGGQTAKYGDAAVTIELLPRIPVTYIIWGGDDELKSECRILFDVTASYYLNTEDLVVLTSLGAYKLISVKN